ncbi:MAG: hypothetical protein J5504_06940 [Butyrivibrio sp.]|nr:hypothetical protein [Butyrivibrio sp.]
MRKRGISAIASIILIAGLAIAECFCSSVPTYASEVENLEDTNNGRTLKEEPENNSLETIYDSKQLPGEGEVKKEEEIFEKEEALFEEPPLYPATFRILNNFDGEIDSSTAYSTGNDYIAEIEVSNAIQEGTGSNFTSSVSDKVIDKINGITLQNGIADLLKNVPTAKDIPADCSFDPDTQYIAWYYINADNYDEIYVDGVIRSRTPSTEQPTTIDENSSVEKKSDLIPDVTINIETTCNLKEVVYDGTDYYIGGFSITVTDNNKDDNTPLRYITTFFNAIGDFLCQEVNAGSNGSGTYFEHNNVRYWVNIDGAYVKAKEIAIYDIPFIFNNKVIDPKDIYVNVLDDNGNVVSTMPSEQVVKNVDAPPRFKVTQRDLTIEAGTTVQNYSGKTITNQNVEITSGSLLKGHSLVDVVINGSQSGIGSSVNEITSYRIVDEKGNDVTKYYDVKCVNGKLVLVDGNNSNNDNNSKSNDSTDDKLPPKGTKEKKNQKKTVVIGGKAMEKTSAENDNQILGVSRLARMSKTFDASNINLRLMIILIAAGFAIYLSQLKIKE